MPKIMQYIRLLNLWNKTEYKQDNQVKIKRMNYENSITKLIKILLGKKNLLKISCFSFMFNFFNFTENDKSLFTKTGCDKVQQHFVVFYVQRWKTTVLTFKNCQIWFVLKFSTLNKLRSVSAHLQTPLRHE